jgi:hypothetical protein
VKNIIPHVNRIRGTVWFLAWVALAVFNSTSASALPRLIALEAIHQIENPRDLKRPGPFGELGAYQFRAKTWAQYSRRPFTDALDRRCSDGVAVQHYNWLCDGLVKNGLEASVYNVALAWNAGLYATVRGRAPRRSHDYAVRVGNIAADLHERSQAIASR